MLGWLAKSALMMSPVGAYIRAAGGLISKIPWQVWVAIGAALVLWLGVRWHAHEVKKTYRSGYDQAVADIKAQEAAKVAPLKEAKAVADAKNAVTNEQVRKIHDAQNAHIDSNLADLLGMYAAAEHQANAGSSAVLHGPPGATGSIRAEASANDRLAEVATDRPSDELLVAVPAKQLAVRAAICDRDYAALTAWENAYLGWEQTYKDWLETTKKVSR